MDKAKKIFLVDDDEIYLSMLEALLKDKYDVTAAKSGKEALEHLLKGIVPNLILLDILMPDLDGWETFNRLRAISFLQDVPIVFLTSVGVSDGEEHAQQIGAADYITKPFDNEDLLNRIEKILNKGH